MEDDEKAPSANSSNLDKTGASQEPQPSEKKNVNLVEIEGGVRSKNVTPSNTSEGGATASESRKHRSSSTQPPKYGRPESTQIQGQFPSVGSQFGPFFCLGQLGKGTFSSIHRCINMKHDDASSGHSRLAAAKIELDDFSQSGVLDAEATILDFLHQKLKPDSIPRFMGYYRCGKVSALMMEYLSGPDMHQLREKVISDSQNSRRIDIDDAVYLTADVMLPLLQEMHQVGIVHRDVKPSNCVSTGEKRKFKIVDFGLSKSIVVAGDSSLADHDKPWKGEHWMEPAQHQGQPYYRKPREKADFRGTSMYASLRVHELVEYAPRDDIWSLLYVFCDLVSGGLPWMHHAANRDRERCRKMKERIHGLAPGMPDATAELLMGDVYHKAVFTRERQKQSSMEIKLPEPFFLSKDPEKVSALRRAFDHLKSLDFTDSPDYDLIADSIRKFMNTNWESTDAQPKRIKYPNTHVNNTLPNLGRKCKWRMPEFEPYFPPKVFDVPEDLLKEETEDEMSLLPAELRYWITQVEYNALHFELVSPIRAFNDWMKLAELLLFTEWDSKKYELGGHRTSTDGFRREHYLFLLEKLETWAKPFNDFDSYECLTTGSAGDRKRCKITTGNDNMGYVHLARVFLGLKVAIDKERRKRPPPPARIGLKLNGLQM